MAITQDCISEWLDPFSRERYRFLVASRTEFIIVMLARMYKNNR